MEITNNIIHRLNTSTRYEHEPSLGHLIVRNLEKAGEDVMLVSGITGEKLSAAELVKKSVEVSKALLAAGIKQGDVVSIVSENRFEFAFVLFGSIFNNSILAPINSSYSEREINHALRLSKPKVIFVSTATSQKVIRVAKSLSFIQKIILLDDEHAIADNKTIKMRDFLSARELGRTEFNLKPVDVSKTVCFIMCSSGTTGLPKGVQISQRNLILTTRYFENDILNETNVGSGRAIMLGFLPMYHVFGAGMLTCTMAAACGQIVILPRFEENHFFGCIERYRCNVLFLVPPLMVLLAKSPLVDRFDISSVRFAFCGAAPLSKELESAVEGRLRNPNYRLKQGYGMSETTFGVLCQKGIVKAGSVGDVYEGVSAKVIDENGKSLGFYERGELCFKGGIIMLGYIDNESATSALIDEEGWLHTGDVGYFDEDLQFFIVDRIKELIKFKGFQVPPAGEFRLQFFPSRHNKVLCFPEIEALLLTHAQIKDCGVIGKPDEEAGELPLAFVERADDSLTEADVVKFVAESSSPAKRLRGGVIFIEKIPKNPSGKILRRELRELLKQPPRRRNSDALIT